MSFGDKIRIRRTELGLTQKELAKILEIAVTTLSGYENSAREPDVDKIRRLSKALEISADELLEIEPESLEAKAGSQIITTNEAEMIRKYRLLDQRGQQTVLNTLSREYEYLFDEFEITEAAHSGGLSKVKTTRAKEAAILKQIKDTENESKTEQSKLKR